MMSENGKKESDFDSWRYNDMNYYYQPQHVFQYNNDWSETVFTAEAQQYGATCSADVFAPSSSFGAFNTFIDPFWSGKSRLGLYARDEQYTNNTYSDSAQSAIEPAMSGLSLTEKEKKSVSYASIASQPPQQQQARDLKQKSLKSKMKVLWTNPRETETTKDPVPLYNPKEFDINPRHVRFFIIKSYSEDDVHRSIKYSIWCSTEHGNKRLDSAFKQMDSKGPIYLLFSVNGSGHFCGMSQMVSPVDYSSSSSVWAQDKWKGQFKVKWIYVKDVPNSQLRHIRLENNDNKPVTNSRDTQEVPPEKGKMVLKIMHHFRHTTSIFDDYSWYEARESEKRTEPPPPQPKQQWKQ